MVHVEDVDLTAVHVRLPTHLVGMVVMQPFLDLTGEPFRCLPDRKPAQLAAIERTLAIARTADHGAERTHFTLIPEYCIPGLEGIARIEAHLRDQSWPTGTIVIGGTDALSREDYATVCEGPDTSVDGARNGPDRVQDGEWINCCVTWVKTGTGQLRRWLQPKLAPAWPEQNITHTRMFRGGSVFLFRCAFENGTPCRFFSLLCFDWVGVVGGQTIPQRVLARIHAQGQEVSLSWVFVPQHNERPSHAAFLTGVAQFFEEANSPLVFRHRCSVLFLNTAGRKTPGHATTNGCTGLVLSPLSPFDLEGCHPTYSGKPRLLRGSDALGRCKDTLFREKGACIHSFSQNLLVDLGAGGRTLPLHRAHVHSIAPGVEDPRAPGTYVSACVKWVNDSLDDLPCLSQQVHGAALASAIAASHQANVALLRVVESSRLETAIDCATWRARDVQRAPAADDWGGDQTTALAHLTHTLDILRLGGTTLDFARPAVQAAATLRHRDMEVLAVSGPSHEDCFEHVEKRFVLPARRQVLIVTRDPQNAPRLRRQRSILRPTAESALGAETKITDASSAGIHVAFRDLLDLYIAAPTAAALEEALYARLAS